MSVLLWYNLIHYVYLTLRVLIASIAFSAFAFALETLKCYNIGVCFDSNNTNAINFHPLGVVVCCSCDTQLQMGKNKILELSASRVNPYPAKLIYLNFHPLEVVSRYRDPQLTSG